MDKTKFGASHPSARAILLVVVLGLMLAGILVIRAAAQDDAASPVDRDVVSLSGTLSDVQFLAGRSVTVKATVSDDVFAAGQDVTFDAATLANTIVAGYDVEMRGGTTKDFIAAAANLKIGGKISDDLVAAGRSIRITPEGSVGGDARLAAETIDVDGQIAGSLRAAAQRVTITGRITGKADLLAQRIVIAAGAEITGDLVYRGKEKPDIATGAKIGGTVRQIAVEVPDFKTVGWALLGIGLLIAVGWMLAVVLLVAVLNWAFPHVLANAAARLREQPLSSLGLGVGISLVAAAIAGGLMATVIGIPLGSALFMGLGVLWLMGVAATSAFVGLAIGRWWRSDGDTQSAGLVAWAVLGAVVLGAAVIVPVVGWLLASLAVVAGLGAAAGELWRRLRTA